MDAEPKESDVNENPAASPVLDNLPRKDWWYDGFKGSTLPDVYHKAEIVYADDILCIKNDDNPEPIMQ